MRTAAQELPNDGPLHRRGPDGYERTPNEPARVPLTAFTYRDLETGAVEQLRLAEA